MLRFLSFLAAGFLGIALVGVALLSGGYHLSKALLPHWPTDYHATAAIALMCVIMIVFAGVFAMRTGVSKKQSS